MCFQTGHNLTPLPPHSKIVIHTKCRLQNTDYLQVALHTQIIYTAMFSVKVGKSALIGHVKCGWMRNKLLTHSSHVTTHLFIYQLTVYRFYLFRFSLTFELFLPY